MISLGELVQGVIATSVFGLLYVAARYRFMKKERRGPADIGLD